jgi:hypothetical protein
MNNISNENLESGVLAPRTPSNEEKNQWWLFYYLY